MPTQPSGEKESSSCHSLNRWILLILWVCTLRLPAAVQPGFETRRISLAGGWRFALDPKGAGESERWNARELADTVILPGTVAQNKKGGQILRRDNVMELSSDYPYEGSAWYQKTIRIPDAWQGCAGKVFLERSKLTKAWWDEECLGEQDALGVAQVYAIPALAPGEHRLTIRVDSKARPPGGSGGHMITTSVQTKWNGLIGDLHLEAHDPVWIENASVVPDVRQKIAAVTVSIRNATAREHRGTITLSAIPFNVPAARRHKAVSVTHPVTASPGGMNMTVSLPLGPNALLWDEFQPALYRLTANLETDGEAGKRFRHSFEDEFGLREFRTRDGQFTINGQPLLLRGKHDAMAFPLLGHAAMTLEEWMRVLAIAKSYGINHYRFHTCTPPKAAFQAADRIGIYMQPELYHFGGTFREGAAAEYTLAEGKRILTAYGNSPSFVMLSLGNEIWEGREVRARTVAALRQFDPSRLYAQGSNNEFGRPTLATGDDYWTTARTLADSVEHAVRGSFSHADQPLGHIQRLRPATTYDYRAAIQGVPVPVIGHEVGQFEVFPSFREIQKYTGVQKPWNFETFRRRLEAAGMLDQSDAFVAASGALVAQCYREEIETCLRTPGFGGFQLLDLQDFPGQGTALVGILDAFMESKGLVQPETWRQFCGPVVPLARMPSYTWNSGQSFQAEIEVAQYGAENLSRTPLHWTLENAQGKVVARGTLPTRSFPQGSLVPAGSVAIPLARLPVPAQYTFHLRLGKTGYQNQYPVWIYPQTVNTGTPASVNLRRVWDDGTKALLAAGKTVVLLPASHSIPGIDGFFTPDFWCYPMFRSICEGGKKPVAPGTLGLLIDARHPALAAFPTETHSNWQWWDLVMGSRAAVLNGTPSKFRPIVQVIDNFERNHKLGFLFEAKVGPGSLLVCTLDLLNKQDSPVARQMLHSLMQYAQSGCSPKDVLAITEVNSIFAPASQEKRRNKDGSYSEFFERKE
jgi:hypothetical protein